MSLQCISTLVYWVLLWHFLIGYLSSRNCLIDVAFPTFQLGVHVLTFSPINDQYTSFTIQKVAIYTGQISSTAKILSQGLTC